jgi:hypothetical protein
LSSFSPNKSLYLSASTVTVFANTVFSGYIVSPAVFPDYWHWLYWLIPSGWYYRLVVLNQFLSSEYSLDEGEAAMKSKGFHRRDGSPFEKEWIGYCFLVLLLCSVLSILTSAFCLHYFRMEPQPSGKVDVKESSVEVEESERDTEVEKEESSFIPVDLSFNNLCYEVKASTGKKKLRLLNNISGIFRSGRMCALMGESGAGEYSVTLYSYTLQ